MYVSLHPASPPNTRDQSIHHQHPSAESVPSPSPAHVRASPIIGRSSSVRTYIEYEGVMQNVRQRSRRTDV